MKTLYSLDMCPVIVVGPNVVVWLYLAMWDINTSWGWSHNQLLHSLIARQLTPMIQLVVKIYRAHSVSTQWYAAFVISVAMFYKS